MDAGGAARIGVSVKRMRRSAILAQRVRGTVEPYPKTSSLDIPWRVEVDWSKTTFLLTRNLQTTINTSEFDGSVKITNEVSFESTGCVDFAVAVAERNEYPAATSEWLSYMSVKGRRMVDSAWSHNLGDAGEVYLHLLLGLPCNSSPLRNDTHHRKLYHSHKHCYEKIRQQDYYHHVSDTLLPVFVLQLAHNQTQLWSHHSLWHVSWDSDHPKISLREW